MTKSDEGSPHPVRHALKLGLAALVLVALPRRRATAAAPARKQPKPKKKTTSKTTTKTTKTTRKSKGPKKESAESAKDAQVIEAASVLAREKGMKVESYEASVTADSSTARVSFDNPKGPPADRFIVLVDMVTGKATRFIPGK